MIDDDIELSEEIKELIDTYTVNCSEIENQALEKLCSVEIPMFSVLRDLTAHKCYSILARMRDWFGSTPEKEHYLCLMILTDYVSCSYNNNDFYGTFVGKKKDKFYESFFVKLLKEWKIVFNKMPIAVLPTLSKFELLKNSLRVSIARFPNKFMFKWILSDILNSCDEYGLRLQKHLSDVKASQEFRMNANFFHKTVPVLSANCSTLVPIANVSKSISVPVPHKMVQNPIKTTAPLKVIVIEDSPVKMDKAQSKLGNITNVVSSKAFERSSETYEVLKPLNSEVKRMKFQNDIVVSDQPTKNSLPRKLNAFDILMRKKVIKPVS